MGVRECPEDPAQAMKIEDALRKIRLLRLVYADNGASDAEAENASNLVRRLMDRFALRSEETREPNPSQFRMSWVYWDQILCDFGLELHHFGKRGSAQIGGDKQVLIRLDIGEWRVQQTTPEGTDLLIKDIGVESFQTYLNKNAPRMHSLTGNRRGASRPR
jgi:hypothetical protein